MRFQTLAALRFGFGVPSGAPENVDAMLNSLGGHQRCVQRVVRGPFQGLWQGHRFDPCTTGLLRGQPCQQRAVDVAAVGQRQVVIDHPAWLGVAELLERYAVDRGRRSIALVLGGIVSLGSNVSTLRQTTDAISAAERLRSNLIGNIDLRVVAESPMKLM